MKVYCDKIKHKISFNKDVQPFRINVCSLSFDNRKAMKRIVNNFVERKAQRTNPFKLGSSVNIGEKSGHLQTSCRLQRFEKTNRQNQLAATKNK